MPFLYHAVPDELIGTTLYPLNELKTIHPDVYAKAFSKYIGREEITQQALPLLGCLWNDVLHFSAVHPSAIRQALIEAGGSPGEGQLFYEIDPLLLNPEKTTVFLYRYKDWDRPDHWTAYHPNHLNAYTTLPIATKTYYTDLLQMGKRPLLYHGVPHILHKGSLDISQTRIISW